MKFLRDKSIAIIGYADTRIERRSGRSTLALAAEVVAKLVERTGVGRKEIDGLAVTWAWSDLGNPFWTNFVADSLGLAPAWSQVTDIGGASATGNIARAAAAIHAGACEIALCLAADAPSTQQQFRQTGFQTEFCEPFGYSGPPVVFGLLSSAYHARYGLPERALAKLAVAQRNGALLNPHACETLRVPLTEQDYLASRMIADPIRLLDCVMRCDGANGFLVTSTERARKLGARMLHPIAYREVIDFDPTQTIDDITVSGFSTIGPAALAWRRRTCACSSPTTTSSLPWSCSSNSSASPRRAAAGISFSTTTSGLPVISRSTPAAARFRPGRRVSPAAASTWSRRCNSFTARPASGRCAARATRW